MHQSVNADDDLGRGVVVAVVEGHRVAAGEGQRAVVSQRHRGLIRTRADLHASTGPDQQRSPRLHGHVLTEGGSRRNGRQGEGAARRNRQGGCRVVQCADRLRAGDRDSADPGFVDRNVIPAARDDAVRPVAGVSPVQRARSPGPRVAGRDDPVLQLLEEQEGEPARSALPPAEASHGAVLLSQKAFHERPECGHGSLVRGRRGVDHATATQSRPHRRARVGRGLAQCR